MNMKIDELNEIGWHLRATAKSADRLIDEFRDTIKERDRLKRRLDAYDKIIAALSPEKREKFNSLLFIVEKGLLLYSIKQQFGDIEIS